VNMEYFTEAVRSALNLTVQDELPIKGVKDVNKQYVVPMSRWNMVDDSIIKTYTFVDVTRRRKFVSNLLAYEERIGKFSLISVQGNEVTVSITAELHQRMSKLDKMYARYADALYKDVVYV
jgi:pterin-4a-carbinolamine dehydratase